ncbi:MAG: GyrI-like domain-containing protein [Oscillospiraceae bacterium]|nr:GyrI-like domain-containing protein [Oscillospiraceae bacterium]
MDYTIIEKESFKVIGIRRTTPYGGGTWAIVKTDGSNEAIKELSGKFYDLGLCFGFGEDGSNDYMCGIEWDKEDVPGLDSFEYPKSTWLKFEATGSISNNTLGNVWNRINNEFLPQSKYKKSGLPTIEKYVYWDEAIDKCNVEIWIPVALK